MEVVTSIKELRKLINDMDSKYDDYKITLSVDNGVDGKSADNGMSSHNPRIRVDVFEEEKEINLSGSEY